MASKLEPLAFAGGIVALGLVVFAGGQALSASYSDTKQAPSSVKISTGSVVIGNYSGSYSATIAGVMPGETRTSLLSIRNGGSLPWSSLDLKITATGALVDNPTYPKMVTGPMDANGNATTIAATWGTPLYLQSVKTCNAPWSGNACPGAEYDVSGGSLTLKNLGFLKGYQSGGSFPQVAPGETLHVKMDYALPGTAKEEYDGESATVTYGFTVTQRQGMILP